METLQLTDAPAAQRENNLPAETLQSFKDIAPSTGTAPHRYSRAAREAITTIVAQLLRIFPGLSDSTTAITRLFLAMVGFVPVTLIAISTFDIVGLRDLATHVLVPAVAATFVVAVRHRWSRRLVIRAIIVGALATSMYDLIRFGFIWTGLMHTDPIPHIGVDLHLHPAWVVGYLWRYLANGAGLSIAFFSLGFTRVRQGLLFGFFVACGLITVLIVSPHATEVLWPVNATSVAMIVSGHLAFGASLAVIRRRLDPCSTAASGSRQATATPAVTALPLPTIPAHEPMPARVAA